MWVPLFGYENNYLIDHNGNIKNKNGLVLKSRIHKDGYPRIGLKKDGSRKEFYIHRLVALTFIVNPENLQEINHINGIKTDSYVENLEWITHSNNLIHAIKTGLMNTPDNYHFIAHQKGETHGRAKLTALQVSELRTLKTTGIGTKELSIKFNISKRTVRSIVSHERWKDS